MCLVQGEPEKKNRKIQDTSKVEAMTFSISLQTSPIPVGSADYCQLTEEAVRWIPDRGRFPVIVAILPST